MKYDLEHHIINIVESFFLNAEKSHMRDLYTEESKTVIVKSEQNRELLAKIIRGELA